MALKHRIETIEKKMSIKHVPALWIIRDIYNETKDDPKGKKRVQAKIQKIKDGKVKNKDGTYYQKNDSFMIISRIFSPRMEDLEALDMSDNEDFQKSMSEYKKEDKKEPEVTAAQEEPIQAAETEPIEERIEALKKRKQDLERKIKEQG